VGFDRLAFVQSACATVDGEMTARAWLTLPWTCEGWLGGTDGHVMLAVPAMDGDPSGNESGRPGTRPASLEQVVQDLNTSGQPSTVATVAALREWAGPVGEPCNCGAQRKDRRDCSDCGGTGYQTCVCSSCDNEHESECEECGGTGMEGGGCGKCEGTGRVSKNHIDRIGYLCGRLLNMRKLGHALRLAPDGDVAIHVQTKPYAPLILVGHDWRGLIMPIHDEVTRDKKPSSFGAPT
jgi:hypothetical protein